MTYSAEGIPLDFDGFIVIPALEDLPNWQALRCGKCDRTFEAGNIGRTCYEMHCPILKLAKETIES